MCIIKIADIVYVMKNIYFLNHTVINIEGIVSSKYNEGIVIQGLLT